MNLLKMLTKKLIASKTRFVLTRFCAPLSNCLCKSSSEELDDEFAKDVDEEVDTLVELKAKTRERLEAQKQNAAKEAIQEEVIDKAVWAKFKRVVFALATVKSNTINFAFKVDNNCVADL